MSPIDPAPLARAARFAWQRIQCHERQLDREDLSESEYTRLMASRRFYQSVLADLERAIARQLGAAGTRRVAA